MNVNNIRLQDSESEQTEGLDTIEEEDDERLKELDTESEPDGDDIEDDVEDDGLADSEEDPDEISDDDDEEELVEAEPPKRAPSLTALADDDDVQMFIEDAQEARKTIELDLHNAEKGDYSYAKQAGLKTAEIFPQVGGRTVNIYALDHGEFNSLIEQMEDTEGISRAYIREVMSERAKYDAKLEMYREKCMAELSNVNRAEWELIGARAPKIVQDNEDKIRDWIMAQFEKDPNAYRRANRFKGKLYLVSQAIKELKLKEGGVKFAKQKELPKVHAVKGKSQASRRNNGPKRTFTRQEIANMSMEEYTRNAKAIQRAMEKGLIK